MFGRRKARGGDRRPREGEPKGPRFLRGRRPPRRRDRQRGRLRRALALLGWALPRLAAVAALGTAAGGTVYWLLTAPRFGLREVEIAGGERVDLGDLPGLRQARERRVNLFLLDLEELTRGVAAHPWVARCRVRRILPDRLRVELVEEEPAGLARHGEELLLINRQGEVIERNPPESCWAERFPVVAGFRADEPWEACRERARAALGLASLLGGRKVEDGGRPPAAEWIDASDPANLAVHFRDRACPVYVGNGDFSERLARYRFLEPIIRERQEEDLQYVDLRFRDRVIVMPSAEESMEEEADGQDG